MSNVARLREALRVFAPGAASTTEATSQLLRVAGDAFDEPALARIADRLAGGCEPLSATAVNRAVSAAALAQIEERPSERQTREAAALLAEFYRLGGARGAAAKIARKRFPRDPAARATLERRINRLAQKREENRTMSGF